MSETSPFNLRADVDEALETLRFLQTPDNPDFLSNLINVFITDSKKQLAESFAALDANDLPTVGKRAHSLKSSMGSFGANWAGQMALKAEQAAKAGDATQARQAFEVVRSEFTELSSILKQAVA